ncbi:potassium channel family protein [Neptuniibacter sp.]|uniref:potassium channel family protein n=1 Tax=Neptuniibacter sp. TaxID=1962643 RepID=UPI00262A81AB|nr:potassium channel family protein [Neptuniibacter sp.]MCP4598266.1 hypothetical protein [Neptuniibacter sp.]
MRFKRFQQFISQPPKFYASFYFSLVLMYTGIYLLVPGLIEIDKGNTFEYIVKSFYFSVITITTLGYGDVSPENWVGQLATASEALLGIVMIGLFLNALSHQHSSTINDIEKSREASVLLQKDLDYVSHLQLIFGLKVFYFQRTIYSLVPSASIPLSDFHIDTPEGGVPITVEHLEGLEDKEGSFHLDQYLTRRADCSNFIQSIIISKHLERWPEFKEKCVNFIEAVEVHYFTPEQIQLIPKAYRGFIAGNNNAYEAILLEELLSDLKLEFQILSELDQELKDISSSDFLGNIKRKSASPSPTSTPQPSTETPA